MTPPIEVQALEPDSRDQIPAFVYRVVVNGRTVWKFYDKYDADLLAEMLKAALWPVAAPPGFGAGRRIEI